MLVLSRKTGECVRIGDDIEVTVIEIRKGRVRLGIQAPRDVPVHREEVFEQLVEKQGEASDSSAESSAEPRSGEQDAEGSLPQSTASPSGAELEVKPCQRSSEKTVTTFVTS